MSTKTDSIGNHFQLFLIWSCTKNANIANFVYYAVAELGFPRMWFWQISLKAACSWKNLDGG